MWNEVDNSNTSTVQNHSKHNCHLTDEIIDSYIKALQIISQNKVQVDIEDITERSAESELTSILEAGGSVLRAPSNNDSEMKSIIISTVVLDHDSRNHQATKTKSCVTIHDNNSQ